MIPLPRGPSSSKAFSRSKRWRREEGTGVRRIVGGRCWWSGWKDFIGEVEVVAGEKARVGMRRGRRKARIVVMVRWVLDRV